MSVALARAQLSEVFVGSWVFVGSCDTHPRRGHHSLSLADAQVDALTPPSHQNYAHQCLPDRPFIQPQQPPYSRQSPYRRQSG